MKSLDSLGTVITTDVLILGAGGAGMCAALKAAESHLEVLLVDKCGIGWNGQVPIGGGILAYVYTEYVDKWARKVTEDSHYFNNQEWTYQFGSRMHQSTHDLAGMGLTFLKKDGQINVLNWGPNINVTLFDAPKSLVALKKTARSRGVKMMDKIYIIDLLKSGNRVAGAVGLGLTDGKTYIFKAKSTIVATGNCGYQHEKTYCSVQGEGPAMGYRAGAELVNAEFNSSYVWGIKILGKELMGIHFYLYLENARGEKIMGKYYPELMVGKHSVYTFDPRVINAMQNEVKAGLGPIYINLTGLSIEEINELAEEKTGDLTQLMANDTLKLLKEKAGVDPQKERMEMWPRYLYSGGGLKIDLQGKTSLEGLWAAGSGSNNCWTGGGGSQGGLGVHSAAITGFVAGQGAAESARTAKLQEIDPVAAGAIIERVMEPCRRPVTVDPSTVTYKIHEAIVPMKYNRQREAGRLREALQIIESAKAQIKTIGVNNFHDLARYHSAESMAMCAEFTLRSSLMREESRAAHFREDFPQRDDKNWFSWITIQSAGGQTQFKKVPVPSGRYGSLTQH
jgi:succinate dehydrogenase / fumarate reductase, flavoprotein subunit